MNKELEEGVAYLKAGQKLRTADDDFDIIREFLGDREYDFRMKYCEMQDQLREGDKLEVEVSKREIEMLVDCEGIKKIWTPSFNIVLHGSRGRRVVCSFINDEMNVYCDKLYSD